METCRLLPSSVFGGTIPETPPPAMAIKQCLIETIMMTPSILLDILAEEGVLVASDAFRPVVRSLELEFRDFFSTKKASRYQMLA
ncbi:hypothetical protein LMH87_005909 [Akanthomyces muscarius]|uniref:Uncharacterized protein n=1 Tax=Akanthomyces muscarius TaxID=2231603 RepID=A0A9W8QPA2_AKAMU|nr:hypothetical protein LMH87_005909 [Akanthomyces muscarius]KAJ4164226.1 hypothetical protein LMH87_005909 [Akanthomyces muscarius]